MNVCWRFMKTCGGKFIWICKLAGGIALLVKASSNMPNSFAKKWNVGDCSLHRSIGSVDHRTKMTGDESRELEIGARVCWGADKNDQGTVIGTVWNEIIID